MTQGDVYKKFLIEYDKGTITSSYPSLTNYEIATLLDKAYLALIGEKVTGNNARGAQFESDIKAMEDIRPLLVTETVTSNGTSPSGVTNAYVCNLPKDSNGRIKMLYYVSATMKLYPVTAVPNRDSDKIRVLPVSLISHAMAQRFFATPVNIPWIKTPVAYIEGKTITVLYDKYTMGKYSGEPRELAITYIKIPKKFTDNAQLNANTSTEMEINDSMVEELINLAIVLVGETVESPRMQTKAQLRQLEA